MDKKNTNEFVTKWESQVKKGTLEFVIMLCLKKQRYYGYELISDIKQLLSFDVAEGTVYPLLNRLKKEELIDSEWVEMETGIPRKYYKITDKGIAAMDDMQNYWVNLSLSIQKLLLQK